MRKFTMLGFVILTVILAGCSSAETPPPTVVVEDYVPVISVTGKVLPARRATISAQVGGAVLEIFVAQGDEVDAGQTLARLDAVDAELAVQRAEATLASAQALAERNRLAQGIQVEIAEAEAELAQAEAARKQAQIDYDQKRDRDVADWIEEEAATRLRGAEHALILADEPTGDLDTESGGEVIALMRQLNRDLETTFIVVTHDPAAAQQTERVLIMRDGQIVHQHPVRTPFEEDWDVFRRSELGKAIREGDEEALTYFAPEERRVLQELLARGLEGLSQ